MAISAADIGARKMALAQERAAQRAARKKIRAKVQSSTDGNEKEMNLLEVLVGAVFALVINDLPDIANIAVLPQFITGPIDLLTWIIMTLWLKIRGGEKLFQSLIKNGFVTLIELIPFVGIFPTCVVRILNKRLHWFDWFFNLPVKILSMFTPS